jgi:hypothetical protein
MMPDTFDSAYGPSSTPPTKPRPFQTPISVAHTIPSEESTEVHIHIGRIEVTAVHETAPLSRERSAAPSPMSLDAYLVQRGRT